MTYKKVNDLLSRNLLLKGTFHPLFGQHSIKHIWEFFSWFQEHLKNLLVKFVLGVGKHSKICLDYYEFLSGTRHLIGW